MSIKSVGETLQWILTLASTAHNLKDSLKPKPKTTPEKTEPSAPPPPPKPGAFGLSLEDERIIAGVICQLEVEEQLLITDFLVKKCKNFQRKRFIEVVSGLEVTMGAPAKTDRVWDSKLKRNIAILLPAVPAKDRRQEFLKNLAKILGDPAKADKAFDYVVGARTILKDSPNDMLKEEAKKLKRMRAASKKKPGGYKDRGFFKTAISFRREK